MNQKGFGHLALLIIGMSVAGIITVAGVKVLHKSTAKIAPTSQASDVSSRKASQGALRSTGQTSPTVASTPPPSNTTTSTSTAAPRITTSAPSSQTTYASNGASLQQSGSTTTSSSSQQSTSSPTSTTPANPTIGNLVPVNGVTVTGNQITFDCSYTTPAGFSKLIISTVDSSGQDAYTGGEQDIASAGCASQIDITYLSNGQYTTTFTVYDINGNTASASTTYTISH